MSKTRLVLASHKGGAGKSTIALNLAAVLATRGFQVVVIDLDPQGALIFSLGGGNFEYAGFLEVLVNKKDISQALIKSKIPNLYLLSTGKLHAENVPKFENTLYRDNKLAKILNSLEDRFDYIFIDTPTGMGRITRMALRVGSHLLFPMPLEIAAARSVGNFLHLVDYVQRAENPGLKMLGMLLTMVDTNEPLYRLASELRSHFPFVLKNDIPRCDSFYETSAEGTPILLAETSRKLSKSFSFLADEILALTQKDALPLKPFFRCNLQEWYQARKLALAIGQREKMDEEGNMEKKMTVAKTALENPPAMRFNDKGVYRQDVWNVLLGWVLKVSSMQNASVIDDRGLTIAASGDESAVNEMKSSILKVVGQMEKLGVKTIQLQFADKWFSAFYLPAFERNGESEKMLVCLSGTSGIEDKVREKISALFVEKIRDI